MWYNKAKAPAPGGAQQGTGPCAARHLKCPRPLAAKGGRAMKNDIDELLSRAFGRRTAPAAKPQLTLGPQPGAGAHRPPAGKAAQGTQAPAQKQPAAQQAAPCLLYTSRCV